MGDRRVCCCSTGAWTKAIGWCQVISAPIILCAIVLSVLFGPDESDRARVTTVAAAVSTVLEVLSFIMGIVLLRGSYSRNTYRIYDWMVYVIFTMVMLTITAIALCFAEPTVTVIASSLGGLVLVLAFHGFCLWVVGIHKKDIEESSGLLVPLIDDRNHC